MDEYIEEYSLSHKGRVRIPPLSRFVAKKSVPNLTYDANDYRFVRACNESAEFRRYYLDVAGVTFWAIADVLRYIMTNLSPEFLDYLFKKLCFSKIKCESIGGGYYVMEMYKNDKGYCGSFLFYPGIKDIDKYFDIRGFQNDCRCDGIVNYIRDKIC